MSKAVKEQLIKALACGDFVSGQQFGEQVGVSRAAISNHIKTLTEMGLDIFRVTGKGYKLAQPINLLELGQIEKNLAQLTSIELPIEVHSIIDSTNSYLLRKIPNIKQGQTCIAEYQQAGRGRRGRKWQSPFGSHLYLSLYWPLEQGMSEAMGLSLVIGLAISDAIQKFFPNKVELKWPNDVYVSGKKIAGILVELEGQAQGLSHCVIGVGINVQMPKSASAEIDQPWTDLASHHGDKIDRNKLVSEVIHCIYQRLKQHQISGFSSMIDEWQQQDLFLNKPVKIVTGSRETFGIYRGVNEQGALLLEVNGKISPVYGGEISLRSAI